jgi:hypothetical protein
MPWRRNAQVWFLEPDPESQCAVEAKVASKILEDRALEVKDLDMYLCVF